MGNLPQRLLPRVGQMLGPYRLREVLGRGGMGQVYAAHDTILEREVALKVLWEGDADVLVREGRALAAIDHPSVVRIHGIDVSGSLPFVVMERVHGRSLADLLEGTARLPRGRALEILRGVALGLDAIHAAGRVHGDVKPENVLIENETGRVVLTDLGLSRAVARSESVRAGTPAYMPPERAQGVAIPPELQPREDVYSLAVMAFELVTGRLPFEHRDYMELLRHHAVSAPPRPSDLEPSLPWRCDHALLGALAKRPAARHSTAGGFIDQLERGVTVGGGPLVLVADDDGALARMLSLRIAKRMAGSLVRTVTCGTAAYELALRDLPDALITDVEMPGMNGLELLASIRDDLRLATIPRIVVSGRATHADFAIFERLGVAGCFPKPVDTDALVELLRDALHLEPRARKTSGAVAKVDSHAATLPDVASMGAKMR